MTLLRKKKRTQQAVLITVDGNNTVVNMAEQPSKNKLNCAFVFFYSITVRKYPLTHILY